MICEVRARSVAHLAHWMCEVWPWRYLSVGAEMGSSVTGAGMGVGQREKGLEFVERSERVERVVAVVDVLALVEDESVVDVEAVESEES